jgi:hypothetical protein
MYLITRHPYALVCESAAFTMELLPELFLEDGVSST